MNFIEASALDRSNVVYAFETIIRDMYRSLLYRPQDAAYSHQAAAGPAHLTTWSAAAASPAAQSCCRYS